MANPNPSVHRRAALREPAKASKLALISPFIRPTVIHLFYTTWFQTNYLYSSNSHPWSKIQHIYISPVPIYGPTSPHILVGKLNAPLS